MSANTVSCQQLSFTILITFPALLMQPSLALPNAAFEPRIPLTIPSERFGNIPGKILSQGHEVYRAWVALRDAESGNESGVQGFLKLTVTVLGPGDRQRVHDLAEEIQVGAGGSVSIAGLFFAPLPRSPPAQLRESKPPCFRASLHACPHTARKRPRQYVSYEK